MQQRYLFPHVCARCAAGEPAATWKVKGPTKVTEGSAAVVTSTPVIEVPICAACRRRLIGTLALTWLIGLALGAMTFFWINGPKIPGPDRAYLITAAVVGLVVAAIGACLSQFLMKSELTLGLLNPEGGTIHFRNPEYQRLFNEINFVPGAALESAPATSGPSGGGLLRPVAYVLWVVAFFVVGTLAISALVLSGAGDDPATRRQAIEAAGRTWGLAVIGASIGLAVMLGRLNVLPGTRRPKD